MLTAGVFVVCSREAKNKNLGSIYEWSGLSVDVLTSSSLKLDELWIDVVLVRQFA